MYVDVRELAPRGAVSPGLGFLGTAGPGAGLTLGGADGPDPAQERGRDNRYCIRLRPGAGDPRTPRAGKYTKRRCMGGEPEGRPSAHGHATLFGFRRVNTRSHARWRHSTLSPLCVYKVSAQRRGSSIARLVIGWPTSSLWANTPHCHWSSKLRPAQAQPDQTAGRACWCCSSRSL